MPKTEILALGSLTKWPRRCSAAEGTAACGARGRPPGLACSVRGLHFRARTVVDLEVENQLLRPETPGVRAPLMDVDDSASETMH